MNPLLKKNLWLAKMLVTLIFIAWLLHKVHWSQVWVEVQRLQPEYLFGYMFVFLLGITISAYKWQFLGRKQGFDVSVRSYWWAYMTGSFLNNFFPSTIGGDTYRVFWLARDTGRKAAALLSIILDRVTGLVATLVLALTFSLSQWSVIRQSTIWLSAEIFLWGDAVFLGIIWIFGVQLRSRYRHFFQAQWLNPVRVLFAESFSKQVFAVATGYAILFNFIGVGIANYILFQALGISVSFLAFASAIFLISIISSLPISINNIGVKEWGYYTFFGLLGVNAEAAITVAITGRALQMLVSFLALPRAWKWAVKER